MKKDKTNSKRTSIGGQAVIEGVMMRGKTSMATAVRVESGEILVETSRLKSPEKQNKFLKLPLVRGVVAFFNSLVGGTKTLLRSASVFGDDEPTKFEKWLAEKKKARMITEQEAMKAEEYLKIELKTAIDELEAENGGAKE
jgi:uncharacterized protein YqhQ